MTSPIKKKIIKKKKKTITTKKKKKEKKKRNENHSQSIFHRGTHTNYLPKYLSLTNNLLD